MNKSTLMHAALPAFAMTAAERAKGRFMRAPDHPTGDDSQGGGDNTGGNSGTNGGDSTQQNNGGQPFDAVAFWNSAGGSGSGSSPSGESAGSGDSQPSATPKPGEQSQQPNAGQQMMQTIQQSSFAKGIMTDTAIAELAEGKTEAFTANLDNAFRQAMTETMRMTVGLMGQFRDQMGDRFTAMMEGKFQSRDNDADLVKAIPSAADPAVRPMVQAVFEQAMKHAKNDRQAAIQHTKEMLKIMGQKTAGDSGLNLAPKNPGDGQATVPSNTNWFEELTGRG